MKFPTKLGLTLLLALCFSAVYCVSFFNALAASEPTKLKIYVGPNKVPADNEVYEAVFVQLQDAKGNPARAQKDIDISLSSSQTFIGSVDPVITIRSGETYAVAKFYSTYTPGSTTITAAASGFQTVQASIATVGPIPAKLAVYGFPPLLPADSSTHDAVIVQLQDSSGLPAKAPIGDVSVALSSSNTTVGNVDSFVTIKGGDTYAVAKFYTTSAAGSTKITAMASGYATAEATFKTQIFTSDPPIKLKVYAGPKSVPAEGIEYNAVLVQLQDSKGNIAKAGTSVTVTLSSSNIAVGKVSETLEIGVDENYAVAKFYSTFRSGSTTITAAAPDYTSSQESITTVGPVPSKLAVYVVPSTLPADGRQYKAVVVQLQDSGGTPAKDPIGNVTVSLFSSKPDVGNVDQTIVIPYGKTYSSAVFTSAFTAGSTDITATTPGYTAGQAKITTFIIDEYKLNVSVTAEPNALNAGEKATIRVYVSYDSVAPAPGATVKLASDKGGNFSAVTDEKNGYYMAVFTAPSVRSKTVCTITANASKTGYITGNATTQITVNLLVQGASLRIYVKDENENPLGGATVESKSQPPGVSPLKGVTDDSGYVNFDNLQEGVYTFEVTKEGYNPGSVQISVTAGQTKTVAVPLERTSGSPLNLFTIILIIAAAVCAIALVLIIIKMIKKRREETELTVIT